MLQRAGFTGLFPPPDEGESYSLVTSQILALYSRLEAGLITESEFQTRLAWTSLLKIGENPCACPPEKPDRSQYDNALTGSRS